MAFKFVKKIFTMKPLIITVFILLPFLVFGQTSGIITYKENIKINVELPEGMEEFKSMVPTEQSFQKLLLFDANTNLYKDIEIEETSEDENITMNEGGVQMRFEIDRPDNQLFWDNETGQTIEKRDFMNKKFLIEGTTKRYKWEIAAEQKDILGYTCQKAIYKDTTDTVVAWFTSQIPVSTGPSAYAGLPGTILELNLNDGGRITTATKIELKVLEKDSIAKPKKGKKVTDEEFNAIVDRKTKEMQEEFGGSGNVIIKARTN